MKKENIKSKYRIPNNDSLKNYRTDILLLLPLIIIITIIPLIVRSYVYDPKLSNYSWFPDSNTFVDFFLYYKQIILITVCFFMFIIIIFKLYLDQSLYKRLTLFLPLGIYLLLSLISTIFSDYSSYGYSGVFEQFESIFVIISYCIIVLYSYLIIKSENDVKIIFKYFKIGVVILTSIGIAQLLGLNFYESEVGKRFILSKQYWGDSYNLAFNMAPRQVYSSLYNPNYVGVYVALITPIFIVLLLFSNYIKNKLINITLITLLVTCLIGSKSDAGLIGLSITILIIPIFFRRKISKYRKVYTPIIILTLTSIIILTITENDIIGNIKDKFQNNYNNNYLTDIDTNDNNISILYNGSVLNVEFITSNNTFYGFILTDNYGNIINSEISKNGQSYHITDNRFSGFILEPIMYENILSFRVKIDNKYWNFTNQTDNSYYYINDYGKLDKIISTETKYLNNLESFATGRGYIWDRSISLLKEYSILGVGADSFLFAFPQQDYVGLYNQGFSGSVLTKPHSLYFQIAIQSGAISLIAFIIFYLIYFISSLILYTKEEFDSSLSQIGLSIFIGTIGYMVTGLTNDSTICVAPIFWTLLGIGLAINKLINDSRKIDQI